MNPEQYENWLSKLLNAKKMLGSVENRNHLLTQEIDALRDLKRGVFTKKLEGR